MRTLRIWLLVQFGKWDQTKAATPATWGQAMDVPDHEAYVKLAPLLSVMVDETLTPGAAISTCSSF
jgi:hypothetical protein